MFVYNAIFGTTTIVTPPFDATAGNINNKLFPLPVLITITIRGHPPTINFNTSSYVPRNSARGLLYIRRNSPSISIFRIYSKRWNLVLSCAYLTRRRISGSILLPYYADGICKNRCQSMLTFRNASFSAMVVNSDYSNDRPYMSSSIWKLCPAYLARTVATSFTPIDSSL